MKVNDGDLPYSIIKLLHQLQIYSTCMTSSSDLPNNMDIFSDVVHADHVAQR
uniref:Uncharacterized protein n=1 Tax=Nelumbo nucifera TaxID=4432 RepID=A0A822ZUU4_NELNU|nr:TPA_asm: hypothetical protein HUJ06_016573 [Nelumbo nucifera]